MSEIKEDASIQQIKTYLAKNNLNVLRDALDKMRREIRISLGPKLTREQKKHHNILQMRSFLNKNANCSTLNGEWVQELTLNDI